MINCLEKPRVENLFKLEAEAKWNKEAVEESEEDDDQVPSIPQFVLI
jgi:hypothetical protein